MNISDEEIKSKWRELLLECNYEKEILRVASLYPDEKSLVVDFNSIQNSDRVFADELLCQPIKYIKNGEEVILDHFPKDSECPSLHLRIVNIPKDIQKDIRVLRSSDLTRFVSINGIIRKMTEVRPKVKNGAFRCTSCGEINYISQTGFILKYPSYCVSCEKKVGQTKFDFVMEHTVFSDIQRLEIQENPEDLRGGAQPQRLMAYLEDDITGFLVPGDRVTLNGILLAKKRDRSPTSTTVELQMYMQVNSYDFESSERLEMEITEEELEEIHKLAKNKNILQMLTESVAPSIYGMETEKEAFVLQMLGGVQKNTKDKTYIRGDIHILMVGDPGTAKSQLLTWISKLVYRGIYTSGKGTSAAGLTATAVKDEVDGRWTLEAGALVLADGGLAAVDELDKMTKDDRSALHEAMEQQTITIAKAGITATLKSRCGILAAANPKYGKYDVTSSIPEQIDLPPSLLSRFDVIFKIIDTPNEAADSKLAEQILRVHYSGELSCAREAGIDIEETIQEKMINPPIERDLLRKYIGYAKKNVIPYLTDEAMERIKNEYVTTRNMFGDESQTITITPRQLEAMIRLAEATAKARLNKVVTIKDANEAIRIVKYFLKEAATNEDGYLDASILTTGVSTTQGSRMSKMLKIIKNLCAEEDFADMQDVMTEAEKQGIPTDKAREILKKLQREGEIYEPLSNKFKVTHIW